jgi:hypothetical protein
LFTVDLTKIMANRRCGYRTSDDSDSDSSLMETDAEANVCRVETVTTETTVTKTISRKEYGSNMQDSARTQHATTALPTLPSDNLRFRAPSTVDMQPADFDQDQDGVERSSQKKWTRQYVTDKQQEEQCEQGKKRVAVEQHFHGPFSFNMTTATATFHQTAASSARPTDDDDDGSPSDLQTQEDPRTRARPQESYRRPTNSKKY